MTCDIVLTYRCSDPAMQQHEGHRWGSFAHTTARIHILIHGHMLRTSTKNRRRIKAGSVTTMHEKCIAYYISIMFVKTKKVRKYEQPVTIQ